ncbi:MAG: 40S ribosomal protein S19 [Candidatus Micrarchaeaceae archaeon]
MSNVDYVDQGELVKRIAEMLKELKVPKPDYVGMVKTGMSRERVPSQEDFWYLRCASILRQTFKNKQIGISRLRNKYGGRKGHRVRRHHRYRSGGSIIKDAFDALENLGFVKKTEKGRVLTPKGQSFIENAAKSMLKEANNK